MFPVFSWKQWIFNVLFMLRIKIHTYTKIKISRYRNCDNTRSRQKEGWRDGPGGKPLPSKVWGPEFDPQKPREKLGLVAYICVVSSDEVGVGDRWVPGQLAQLLGDVPSQWEQDKRQKEPKEWHTWVCPLTSVCMCKQCNHSCVNTLTCTVMCVQTCVPTWRRQGCTSFRYCLIPFNWLKKNLLGEIMFMF